MHGIDELMEIIFAKKHCGEAHNAYTYFMTWA
jgi:hypothetical protein